MGGFSLHWKSAPLGRTVNVYKNANRVQKREVHVKTGLFLTNLNCAQLQRSTAAAIVKLDWMVAFRFAVRRGGRFEMQLLTTIQLTIGRSTWPKTEGF